MKPDKTIRYNNESEIEKLLVGHKVVDVYGDSLILDNGTKLAIVPNEGCSGCESGNYWVEHITSVNNVITNVEFETEYDEEDNYYIHYKVFVVADGVTTELFDVYGTDGNGWYGTGYEIDVYIPQEKEEDFKPKLKSCPFCESEVVYLLGEDDCLSFEKHYVFCNSCKTSFSNEHVEDSADDTIKWWNELGR